MGESVCGGGCAVLLSIGLGCVSLLPGRGVSHGGIVAALLVIMIFKVCFQQMCFPTSMVRSLLSWFFCTLFRHSLLRSMLGSQGCRPCLLLPFLQVHHVTHFGRRGTSGTLHRGKPQQGTAMVACMRRRS